MSISKDHRIIAFSGITTAVGIVVLWIVFFLEQKKYEAPDAYQFSYDIASPYPDGFFACILCLAAWFLLKGKKTGSILFIISAVYLICLGVLDVGIPLGDMIMAISIIDITANGALNLWCIVLGLYIILKLKPGKNKNARVPTIFSGKP